MLIEFDEEELALMNILECTLMKFIMTQIQVVQDAIRITRDSKVCKWNWEEIKKANIRVFTPM